MRMYVMTSALLTAALAAACDVSRPDYSTRRTPPEVSFAAPPPSYTATPSLTLSVVARNPTGVRAVYGTAGPQRAPGVQQGDGTWTVTVPLPVVGKNAVTVWAEDNAAPAPNSGQGLDAPYQIMDVVTYDPSAPSISYDPARASYSDERNLSVEVDGNGMAKVPAAYSFGPKQGVLPGGEFYKASTRLSAGPNMSASELESTNVRNIPFLRFAVPYDPNTDSPIHAPTFVAHVSCPPPCPAFEDATGELLPAAEHDNQRLLFDLPLATETIPALAQLQGPASLSISVTVADAAGNTTTMSGYNFEFHVIGPPLAIVEDTQYPTAARPDSAYAYRLADATYANQWQVSEQFPDRNVRLLRYIVTNPGIAPVALHLDYVQDPQGSWRAVEGWTRFSAAEPTGRNADGRIYLNRPDTSVAFSMDGFTFHNATYWAVPYGSPGWPYLNGLEAGAHPCGDTHAGKPVHRLGDRGSKYVCSTALGFSMYSKDTESVTASAADVSVWPYRIAAELGGQERDPERDDSGYWVIVPPAAGGVPGALVVYLERAVTAQRSRKLEWNKATEPTEFVDAGDHYQTWDYEWWFGYYQPYSVLYPGYDTYVAFRGGQYLSSAEDHLHGTLTGTTHAIDQGTLVGEGAPRLSVTLDRTPLTTH